MSQFDKRLERKNMLSSREVCGDVRLVGFQKDKDGNYKEDENGNRLPIFEYCKKVMRPRKLKNYVVWECTRSECRGKKYIERKKYTV